MPIGEARLSTAIDIFCGGHGEGTGAMVDGAPRNPMFSAYYPKPALLGTCGKWELAWFCRCGVVVVRMDSCTPCVL